LRPYYNLNNVNGVSVEHGEVRRPSQDIRNHGHSHTTTTPNLSLPLQPTTPATNAHIPHACPKHIPPHLAATPRFGPVSPVPSDHPRTKTVLPLGVCLVPTHGGRPQHHRPRQHNVATRSDTRQTNGVHVGRVLLLPDRDDGTWHGTTPHHTAHDGRDAVARGSSTTTSSTATVATRPFRALGLVPSPTTPRRSDAPYTTHEHGGLHVDGYRGG
jgi:hypothetical protein